MVSMSKFVWMDGKFLKWKEARVHASTHALHYGSAAFEGIRSYDTDKGTAIFRLQDHLNRLFYSAATLGIKIKFSKREIAKAIKSLLKKNNLRSAYIRPLAYLGYGNIGVYPRNVGSNILIIVLPDYDRQEKPLRVKTSSFLRPIEKSTKFGAKISGNYVTSVLAMQEARNKGYDEALMLDAEGFVSEGPIQNIFMVKNKSIIAPSSRSALHGITKDSVINICKDLGMNCYEKKISLRELKAADELFFCGTGSEVVPIISVDDKKIGDGKVGSITKKIMGRYFDAVRGIDKEYIKWLTFI